MRRLTSSLTTLLAASALLLPVAVALQGGSASAAPSGNCPDYDSGRVVVPGNQETTVATAPAGKLIDYYCVKSSGGAGSDGLPQTVTLATPAASTTITYPRTSTGGNLNITHYSLHYVSDPAATASAAPTTAAPTTAAPTTTVPTTTAPTTTGPTTTAPTTTATTSGPFDWNWTYPEPSCSALTVTYPENLPSGQSNDVNIRLRTDAGELTLNYHNDFATWSGTTSFTYAQHRNWPAGTNRWDVVWVQVAGTNYHWQGDVSCQVTSDGDPSTVEIPQAVTEIQGYSAGSVTVRRGSAARRDAVSVDGLGLGAVELQRATSNGWSRVSTLAPRSDDTVQVVYPVQRKRGTARYRLAVGSTESVTGATSQPLVVRVR